MENNRTFTAASDTAAPAAGRKASPVWVAKLPQAETAEQLVIVAGVGLTTACVSMHEKAPDGNWHEIMATPGFIGKNGLGKEREGDNKTPVGTFTFDCAFGFEPDPGCAMPYYQADENDYWSGDTREGHHYNELVHLKDLPDLDKAESEWLMDYPVHYQYCLNISFNAACTPGLGSAIFLHCLAPLKPFTAGCVAIPKDKMITVLRHVKPGCTVVIDALRNLSPETFTAWGLD